MYANPLLFGIGSLGRETEVSNARNYVPVAGEIARTYRVVSTVCVGGHAGMILEACRWEVHTGENDYVPAVSPQTFSWS